MNMKISHVQFREPVKIFNTMMGYVTTDNGMRMSFGEGCIIFEMDGSALSYAVPLSNVKSMGVKREEVGGAKALKRASAKGATSGKDEAEG